jgi:hypothetical protein
MRDDPFRQLDGARMVRDSLLETASARLGQSAVAAGRGTPRFVGRVHDGGSMAPRQDAVYLVHPLLLDGPESEGKVAATRVDSSRSIPVVVIGSRLPVVGDTLIAHAVGGRWVAEAGIEPPNCNPQCPDCPGISYAVSGTVEDPINGVRPIVYDFVRRAWYSAWLPFSGRYILTSGVGQSPCTVGNGSGYYFHKFTIPGQPGGQLAASLFLPGQRCRDARGNLVNAYLGYSGTSYPGLLGDPATTPISGITLPSTNPGTPASCVPLTYNAVWTSSDRPPFTSATYSIPRFISPGYGYSCATPCPLPRKNLTVSWVNTAGNGSGSLVWSGQTQDWTLACTGGLTIRLWIASSNSVGFTATIWDGPGCSGEPHPFNNPAAIGLTAYTCDPLYFAFKVLFTSSLLYTSGYRSFVVTE